MVLMTNTYISIDGRLLGRCALCKAGYKPLCSQTCPDAVYGIVNSDYPRANTLRETDIRKLVHELVDYLKARRLTSKCKRRLIKKIIKKRRSKSC